MISAREAKQRVDKKNQEQIDFHLEGLSKKIIAAADCGEQFIYANFMGIGSHIVQLIKNHLVTEGYQVVDRDVGHHVSYEFKISWQNPPPNDE